ncbi:GH3 auxin-responsive promoter [Pisolithus thermaeus]|nr:GH3 auxin-responsive promoter [Pisolithus croceorrhizus]KAI6159684.1 GH3 auxin-responsive promoter [Pisolithus thermaeus]
MSTSTVCPLLSLSSELKAALQERTEHRLRNIVASNITTHYGTSAASLSVFRQVIMRKNVQEDPTVVIDFRRVVPVTDYESYSPFVAKFFSHPRKQSVLENLLAPGLPSFIGISSSTTRNRPKLFAKYSRGWSNTPPSFTKLLRTTNLEKTAYIYCFGYRELLEVMGEDGEVMKKIPVCIGTCGGVRDTENWSVETDNTRMGAIMPGHVSPWATGFITHHQSFLLIHALFALSEPTLERFNMTFLTFFVDLVHHIQEHWNMLITSIRDGTIPDIEHIDHVRTYLQVNFRANPRRAQELQNIGPPLICSAWAQRVWPNLKTLICICSGTFATVMPKARSVLGENVLIQNVGYGCTECIMGRTLNVGDTETFVLESGDVIEFLDASGALVHDNILQSWDVQPGRCYQPVATTEDGLWRYLIDDVIQVTGFDPRSGSPVFKFYGRKNLAIRLPYAAITEAHLVSVVRAINTEDIMKVQEFTAIVDQREHPQTVGFFFEIIGDIGHLARFARQKAFETLVATNEEHQRAFDTGRLRLPTIRIVRHETFAEYRLWRAESMKAGIGQIKVPVAMSNEGQQEWITERVIMEL